MRAVARSFAVCFAILLAIVLRAQIVYHDTLGVPGVSGTGLTALPSGDLIMACRQGNDALIVGWNNNGDTLWTRSYAFPLFGPNTAITLINGDVLVTSGASGAMRLSPTGDSLGVIGITGALDVCEQAPGQLLFLTDELLLLVDLNGDTLWMHSSDIPEDCFNAQIAVSGDGHIIAFAGQSDLFTYSCVHRILYDATGNWLDDQNVRCDGGSMTHARDLRRMPDGGMIAANVMGTGNTVLVRTNMEGDTLWTRVFGSLDPLPGYPDFYDAQQVMGLSNGWILLIGITFGAPFNVSTLLLDNLGQPVCADVLLPLSFGMVPSSFLTPGLNPPFHTAIDLYDDINAEPSNVVIVGYNDPCFSTAVAPVSSTEEISLFPVPASGTLTLTSPAASCTWTIRDAAGRPVLHGKAAGATSEVSVGALAPGTYVMEVNTASYSRAMRFVVAR